MPLQLRTFQIGTVPEKGDGLRIGTVRYPPRGVHKTDYAKENYFDVWLPILAPSRKLLGWLKSQQKKHRIDAKMESTAQTKDAAALDKAWKLFLDSYEHEIFGNTNSRQALLLLAELAKRTPISIGCNCANEADCHRSRLRELIERVAENGLP